MPSSQSKRGFGIILLIIGVILLSNNDGPLMIPTTLAWTTVQQQQPVRWPIFIHNSDKSQFHHRHSAHPNLSRPQHRLRSSSTCQSKMMMMTMVWKSSRTLQQRTFHHIYLQAVVNGNSDDTVPTETITTPFTNNSTPIEELNITNTNITEAVKIPKVPIVTESIASQPTNNNNNNKSQRHRRRVAILVCPAQFCVPVDYDNLFTILKEQIYHNDETTDKNDKEGRRNSSDNTNNTTIGTCHVCELPRTEWIKVAQQLPTSNFINAQLPIEPTLYWYFNAIESSIQHILAQEQIYRQQRNPKNDDNDDNFSICMIGHSIGGWVARAYLGGLSLSSSALYTYSKQYISSFITLGTPHISPSTALVDQTRGLLAAIEASVSCTPQSLIDNSLKYRNEPLEITCVSSSAISGNFLTTNVEELVAASSYLPLTGKANGVIGDGIVPLELAFLDHPAKRLEIQECIRTQQPIRHCHVLPTPWNLLDGYAPSIALSADTFPSYISDGVVQQWAHCIR